MHKSEPGLKKRKLPADEEAEEERQKERGGEGSEQSQDRRKKDESKYLSLCLLKT